MKPEEPGMSNWIRVISIVVGLFLAGTMAGGCKASGSCATACKKLAKCQGITDAGAGSWKCPLSSECSLVERCYSRCINKFLCETINGTNPATAKKYPECRSQCTATAGDAGLDRGKRLDRGGSGADKSPPSDGPAPADQFIPPQPDACVPNCASKNCGPNGCGGSCGTCKPSEQCKANGVCGPKPLEFGDACPGSTPTLCKAGHKCIALDTVKNGFCSAPCTTAYAACTGAPAGTAAFCLLHESSGAKYCAFVCKDKGQTWSCPSTLKCASQGGPIDPNQHLCFP